jgi:hypothetical protein
MRRTLILMLGIWAFVMPTVCLALCPAVPTAAEIESDAAEPSTPPCHQTAPSDRSDRGSEPTSAPEPNGDCCAEQQLQSIQASAPESPRAPLAFVFGMATETADAVAPTIVSTLRLEAQRVCTPHLQTNPPLLI